MIRWLRSLFAWRLVGERGVWAYFENGVTGARKAVKTASLHGPKNTVWLAGGPWESRPGPTPVTPPRKVEA